MVDASGLLCPMPVVMVNKEVKANNPDTLEVLVEMQPHKFSGSLADIHEEEKKLVGALKTMLGIYAKVRIVSPKSITRSEGKAVRIIDKRKI